MAGPWEKYGASPPATGPWSKYGGSDKGAAPTDRPEVSTTEDVAKSTGAGLRTGIENMVSSAGDLYNAAGSGLGWLAEKAGLSPETVNSVGGKMREMAKTSGILPLQVLAAGPDSGDTRAASDAIAGDALKYEPKTVAGSYAKTGAEFLPAAVFGEGNLGRRLITQALLPAAGSETAGQLTKGTAYEPYARFVGGVAGGMVPSAVGRAISPLPISAERAALADTLRNEGVDLTAGQRSGSDRLRYMESELGGMAGQRFGERQGEQFTRAALQRIGENADRATPEVMDRAYQRIGQQFDDLAARNTVLPDQQMLTDLRSTINEYGSLVNESSRAPIVENTVNDIVDAFRRNGQMSGDAYKSITSRLARAARGTKDPELGDALRGLRENLDDAMERSISANNPADMGAWRETRNQYRNFLTLEQAATGAGESAAAGIISPSALRNATVIKQGRRNYARGRGDFADLARAGEGIMKPLPNSATAARTAARAVGASGPAIAGALLGSHVPAVGTILGGAAGAAAPFLIGRALLSNWGRGYLGNQAAAGLRGADPRTLALISALLSNGGRPALPAQ